MNKEIKNIKAGHNYLFEAVAFSVMGAPEWKQEGMMNLIKINKTVW